MKEFEILLQHLFRTDMITTKAESEAEARAKVEAFTNWTIVSINEKKD